MRLIRFIFCCVYLALPICFCSCERNLSNVKPENEDSDLYDKLSQEEKQFVGYWINSDDYTYSSYFLFRADGSCVEITQKSEVYSGKWTYISELRKLSVTSNGGHIWEVSVVDDQEWMGVYLNSGKVWKFERGTEADLIKDAVIFGEWTKKGSSLSILSNYTDAYSGRATVSVSEITGSVTNIQQNRIGGGYSCYGDFINDVDDVASSHSMSSSYMIDVQWIEEQNKFSYTLYRHGTTTQTVKYQKKTYVNGRWIYTTESKDVTISADRMEGKGYIKFSNPMLKEEVTAEFDGRLNGSVSRIFR